MIGRRALYKEAKAAELIAKLKAGSILRLHCDFIDDPKVKYIVIAHIDLDNDASIVFVVNSEIAAFIEHDAHLKIGQILLAKEPNYTFFDHDSYVNCCEIYDCLDLDFAIRYLIKNQGDFKGELTKEDKDKIISYVKIAQTIAKIDKDIIIKSLSE